MKHSYDSQGCKGHFFSNQCFIKNLEVFKEEEENNKQANTEGESLFWDICSSALASKFLLLYQNTDVLSQEDTWQIIHYVKSGIRGLVQNSKLDYEHGLCVYW